MSTLIKAMQYMYLYLHFLGETFCIFKDFRMCKNALGKIQRQIFFFFAKEHRDEHVEIL